MEWTVSMRDVRMKIEHRVALQNVQGLQMYQAVAEVARAVFSDGKDAKRDDRPVFNKEDQPMDSAEAVARFRDMFGGLG